MLLNQPVKINAERAWRTYIGGKRIDALHGRVAEDSNFPEEWLMSIVSAKNAGREHIVEGLSHTEDGMSLKDWIDQDPKEILGEKFFRKYGNTTGVLVKLLDSLERLTIQVHPTREKAMELFASPYGKTECWHILEVRDDIEEIPCIYMGFREGITREKWQKCFDEQNIPEMLGCLNRFDVRPGDTFIIHGGVPHAIGAGCFLVEIQEPTDYTIRTERVTPSGQQISDFQCHQGLGFEKMMDCFDFTGFSQAEAEALWCIKPTGTATEAYALQEIIGYRNTPMFKLEKIEVYRSYTIPESPVFSGIYILDGEGSLNRRAVSKGEQFFLPATCDEITVQNSGNSPMTLLRFYGPEC